MNSEQLRTWLYASQATLRISANRSTFFVTVEGKGIEETSESSDVEEAIRCAQMLFDARILRI